MKTVPIIYEDAEMLVVNKPFGMAVQGGEGVAHPLTEILEKQLGYKVFLVHRLDKDTSGLLVLAKTSQGAGRLTALISSSQVSKEYHAVCFGVPAKAQGVILDDVQRKGTQKSAVTEYRVLGSRSLLQGESAGEPRAGEGLPPGTVLCEKISLLALKLGTGRTHQIRVHLAGMGCPIVADDKYGDFPANREIRRLLGVRKLQLAAVRLTLPVQGKMRVFEVGVPEHFILPKNL
ncbi:MAG: RluA family pseudouridine synthase [Spirochaetaceae bacterium]|jgi:23S rRNA pseudouridine955/2504/2580 synthase|nr:RluA family pseudouridine synthase [Spirochaetaceae bacterium]